MPRGPGLLQVPLSLHIRRAMRSLGRCATRLASSSAQPQRVTGCATPGLCLPSACRLATQSRTISCGLRLFASMTDEDTSAEACPEAKPPAPSGARAHLDQVQALLQDATLFLPASCYRGLACHFDATIVRAALQSSCAKKQAAQKCRSFLSRPGGGATSTAKTSQCALAWQPHCLKVTCDSTAHAC